MSKQRNTLSRSIRRLGCFLIVTMIALPSEAQIKEYEHPAQAKTAEELLKRLDGEKGFSFWPGKLPPAEAELVAEELRKRFPFESIRERMAFQGPVDDKDLIKLGPKEIVSSVPSSKFKAAQGKSKLKKKAPQPVRKKYDARDSRTIALDRLHSDEVEGFINSPGNGFTRMRSISPHDLRSNRYAKDLETRSVDSGVLGESLVELQALKDGESRYELSDAGMPTPDLIGMFNQVVTGYFAIDTGLVQGLDKVAGFEAHRTRLPDEWNRTLRIVDRKHYEHLPGADINWKANRIQLVSLLIHDEPRVYVSENLPNMEELSGSDVETRALDDFEATALEKLQNGELLVNRASHNRILMMGALRATENCLQCHDVKEDDLLGAFSYEFLREPQSKPAEDSEL